MDKEKLLDIIKNVKEKPNKDLLESQALLMEEFDNTKQLIIDLTRHLEIVEDYYNVINNEIKQRLG